MTPSQPADNKQLTPWETALSQDTDDTKLEFDRTKVWAMIRKRHKLMNLYVTQASSGTIRGDSNGRDQLGGCVSYLFLFSG